MGLGAKPGQGQGQAERTHFSSWGLTNVSKSFTSLKATDSRRFFQKVLNKVFNNQPLAKSLRGLESPLSLFFFLFGCFSS